MSKEERELKTALFGYEPAPKTVDLQLLTPRTARIVFFGRSLEIAAFTNAEGQAELSLRVIEGGL